MEAPRLLVTVSVALCCVDVLSVDSFCRYLLSYFNQISRWIAYLAIWFPLWFRLLTDVSPQLSEEGMDAQERLQFKAELERIQKEAEQIDD
jgi:hypothetical protein